MKEEWKSWHFHHLARRARVFGMEKPLIEAIRKAGCYIAKDKQIPPLLHSN